MTSPVSKNNFSRRELLRTGVIAAGAATLSGLGACQGQPPAVEPPKPAKPTRDMKLSLAAYSMRDALTKGEMDLFGFIDMCAELDLQGTELTSYYFPKEFDNAYLHQLKLHAFKQGLSVSGTAIANDFCKPAGPEKDKELAHVKQWIDYSVEFSAPHIRIFSGHAPEGIDIKQAITWCADGIKESLDYAGQKGIVLGLENHGGITARAADHLEICRQVGNHPWFGVNLDTGNYRTNPYEELAMSAPLSVNVQIKVDVAGPNGQSEPADLTRVRDILVKAGYKGWVALEYEGKDDPKTAIPRYIEELKKLYLG
ncbi:MAG: sugar phosphate isomerase/epimerase family protein [Candidatus Glassbacteria bacterium]